VNFAKESMMKDENMNYATAGKLTRAMLICGVIAGPIYILLGIIQMLIRPGFDPTRHDLSLMSNGDLGWIQITNFVLTGLLTIAAAIGMWRVLHGGTGGTWGPILVAVYGFGLIGAGIFVADPALGFPPGTPANAHSISGHGLMHFVTGGIGFLALIAACFVFARRFRALKQNGWVVYSLTTGILFFAAFFGIAAGSQVGGTVLVFVTLAFTAAVVLAWSWISALSTHLLKI
jgi:hypothetical protein